MKTLADPTKERKFVPVVIQRLAETYKTYAANPHPMKTLIWYEILRDCFPRWGEEVMGADFIRTALFVGDVEKEEPEIPERRTKRMSAFAHVRQNRKRSSTGRAKI